MEEKKRIGENGRKRWGKNGEREKMKRQWKMRRQEDNDERNFESLITKRSSIIQHARISGLVTSGTDRAAWIRRKIY